MGVVGMINDRQITITVGASRNSVDWLPQIMWLSELWERLRTPQRGTETVAEYLELPKGEQDKRKDVGGFVAGTLNGVRRKASAVTGRDIITLDLDNIPNGQADRVSASIGALGCGYCIYSTRKHRPDAPRLRVLFPLDRTCTADEYEPLARKMAEQIGMELADPTTFEAARLMYWPSCCRDGEYIYYTDDKPLLSVDGLLATYIDWRDVTSWPKHPGATPKARLAAKQGDPEEKKGVVGAFCRVYDVPAAIDKFLPGVYAETTAAGRYTFCQGTAAGGAVIYDNGKFLYSHHATDPCSGKLVNAFDCVRLHKFEELDDAAEPGTPVNRLPSYKAMMELAVTDAAVAGLLSDERWEKVQEAFGAILEQDGEDDDGSWRRPPMMDVDAQGMPVKSMKNLRTALSNDPKLRGQLRLNQFSGRIDVTGNLPWSRAETGKTWNDTDAAQLRIYLEPFFGKMAKNDVLDAVDACASDQAYHPVRDYLNSLTWDSVPRLDTMLIDYMGAEDTPYTRAVTRKSFTAAVARVMTPGVKYDTMLVLVGGQGRYKSTLLAKMGGDWFSDSLRTFGDKDAMETVQGTWINEVAEMQALAKAEINAVKMFLSKQSDYYRAAYGRYAADRPRQCVFFGTSNTRDCLIDTTGNRRFWPVDIDRRERTKDPSEDLTRERDQLWAEAMHYWKQGEKLYLSPEIEKAARGVQEDHREQHPWEGIIADFLEEEVPMGWNGWDLQKRQVWRSGGMKCDDATAPRQRVCAIEIWCEALGMHRGTMRQRDAREINNLLARMPGWEYIGSVQSGGPYGKQRCFDKK